MESVTLTIDGQQITVEKGKTVLQAAIEHGISVPYYCYHPGISIDGSCRVCIVKIEKMAKLQTACSTVAMDGMVVVTDAPDVVAARAGVFEFLLLVGAMAIATRNWFTALMLYGLYTIFNAMAFSWIMQRPR